MHNYRCWSNTDAIGIAATPATSPANVTYLPDSVFIIKVSDSLVKLAATAENALKVNSSSIRS